jgi:hypothetical protein
MSLPQLTFQVPHSVQQFMSAELMPVLSSTVAIFEIFMLEWERLHKRFPKANTLDQCWPEVGQEIL